MKISYEVSYKDIIDRYNDYDNLLWELIEPHAVYTYKLLDSANKFENTLQVSLFNSS